MWGFGTRQIRYGGIRLLEWAVGKRLCLMNTCFKKTKSWLMTFRSGETEIMIACMLENNKYRRSINATLVSHP